MDEANVDVTIQEDQYDDGDDWSDEEDNDQENFQPSNVNKESNIRASNLDPITEESRINYSHYSQLPSDDKDSDEITENTQAPTPAPAAHETYRKGSISFGSDSFGKVDDIEKVFREQEEDCHERNLLRPRSDVTHESRIRSWESPPASLNITRVSQNSFSKPFTSTPIAGRVPGPFDAGVSVIQEMSRNNFQNESSTLSSTQVNGLIRDVRMEESSIRNAKNFVLQSKHIPKQSKILDELKQRRENSSLRMNSATSNLKPRQNAILPMQILPRVLECDSLPSRPSTSASATAAEIAIKPEPLSNFGFVAIGEEVHAKIFVRNCSSHILEVIPKLSSRISSFRLASNSHVQIHPNCSQEFIVIFAPTECKRSHQTVHFYVASSGKTYSHKLIGYGGTADVKIVEKRSLSFFPRSGVYRFSPSDISSFGFEIENCGDRAAFVHIVAVDINGIESRGITVEPKSFCLIPKSSNPEPLKTNIVVKVPDNYVQQMCRMSMDSVRSSSTVSRNNIFSLKVYFGDERLRQRAKKYSDDFDKHESFQGLWLTKIPFHINGREMSTVDTYCSSVQDIEMLKTQTRVLTLLVGDDRIEKGGTLSLPSRPQSSFSHLGRLDNGYYIPECNKEGDSTIMTMADPDRTVMK